MIKNIISPLWIFTFIAILVVSYNARSETELSPYQAQKKLEAPTTLVERIYDRAALDGVVDFQLFKNAYIAYSKTPEKKKPLLTIIDYSKPSTDKRFYVIDLAKKSLVYNTYVSHGVNSGAKQATAFSNVINSRKTSLGTFVTDTTYYGSNGYSLRLDGLSRGVNDNARERYIVVHGADYANESFIKKNGYLGRSWGCPALPQSVSKEIIDTIKGGSVIYASS
ncbi:murein L,D-transpeptidase catalytic domain family protein [Vibrio methylphosphonaticus]|uniref:murein L,D-transpeptidase catalytic domain family protein n=1 Tax=Vibrio methylphosphonaticus TaxID=2946866 RepID=UPI002029F037|nr:murein L,D-transpeptidase catalytic domain family protein [Vibrio methylphosphonaticus]MCL9774255.1 murein L,D-transpeptidase catalytic domain family protein [Vibrio methylphosphonaticus]